MITLLIQFVVSLVATLSFAVLFNAPRKEVFFCGLAGSIDWIVYLILSENGLSVYLSSVFATFILTIIARTTAALRRNPVTLYLVPGIFPLVPGAGIYYTAYYLIMGEMSNCASKGVETFLFAGAIALGIVFGFAIPQSLFHSLQKLAASKE